MVQNIEAIFEDGVLRPVDPLQLREHQRVKLTVEPIEQPNEEDRRLALERFIDGARGMGFRSAGAYPTRDELHERR